MHASRAAPLLIVALLLAATAGARGIGVPISWVVGPGAPPEWTLTLSGASDGPAAPPFGWITIARNSTSSGWVLDVSGWSANGSSTWILTNVLNVTMDMRGQFVGSYFDSLATNGTPASMEVHTVAGEFNFLWYGMPHVKHVHVNGISVPFLQNSTTTLWGLYVDPPDTSVVVITWELPGGGHATTVFDLGSINVLLLATISLVIILAAFSLVLVVISRGMPKIRGGREP